MRAVCPVCGRSIIVTAAGRFRVHGDGLPGNLPFQARCKGSGEEAPA
jgi:hypothetical protein